jgi:ribonuclease PH
MTGAGRYVEIQGTAEKTPFGEEQLAEMKQLGQMGIRKLVEMQQSILQARADLTRLFPPLPA